MTSRPTFYLNSRNRPGPAGLAGDQRAGLNVIPGAPIQATDTSMLEYPNNTDLAFVVRLALAQFADVIPNAKVLAVSGDSDRVDIEILNRGLVSAGRIIDARGVGDPLDQTVANGSTILTFTQFMLRMGGTWPLRGLRQVAVIGGGDSGKCAVESLLGIAPQPPMAAAGLDHVERIDWYADVPTTCEDWKELVRGRYQAIGRHLRRDRFGLRRLNIVDRRVQPTPLPAAGLVEGRTYDLVVLCTGNRETTIDGLELGGFSEYAIPGNNVIALKHDDLPAFRVGPHAELRFSPSEREDGVADISANAVSIFRTATKTAALAATLPTALPRAFQLAPVQP
jgi:hypothetical protein